MFKSKKFWAMLIAVLAAIGSGFTETQAWSIVVPEALGLVMAYIMAQGIADAGKEKAKIEAGK